MISLELYGLADAGHRFTHGLAIDLIMGTRDPIRKAQALR
jgi:hypothetical protein